MAQDVKLARSPSAEVINAWSYTSSSPTSVHGVVLIKHTAYFAITRSTTIFDYAGKHDQTVA
jgi:hypothetical protein